MSGGPQLRVILGGRATPPQFGGVVIQLAALEATIPPLDAVVIEDDTYFVLGAAPEISEPREELADIERALREFVPPEPGSVVVRQGAPLQLLAVVHDLEQTPSWREEWIASALDQLLTIAERYRLRTLAMPPLGTIHGRLPLARFAALLREALERRQPDYPETLWLAAPRQALGELHQQLTND